MAPVHHSFAAHVKKIREKSLFANHGEKNPGKCFSFSYGLIMQLQLAL
jgi:hypothetical protein